MKSIDLYLSQTYIQTQDNIIYLCNIAFSFVVWLLKTKTAVNDFITNSLLQMFGKVDKHKMCVYKYFLKNINQTPFKFEEPSLDLSI